GLSWGNRKLIQSSLVKNGCLFIGYGRGCGCRGRGSSHVFVAQACGALEPAAQFAEAFRTGSVTAVVMNFFQLRCKLGGTAVVAGSQNEVQQLFQRRDVMWRAAQNRF